MADTTPIKKCIEPYVRKWLSTQFLGHNFAEKRVTLKTGGSHMFDAVSEDESTVVAILSNRPTTKGDKENSGGVHKAKVDLSLLRETKNEATKVMVFTNLGFHDLITKRTTGLGIETIRHLHCELPKKLQSLLDKVLDNASKEQRNRLK